MKTSARVARRVVAPFAAAAATLLIAMPASAHPSFNPNQLTVGQSHAIDFVIPHGCTPDGGAPAEGQLGSPTTGISLELPAQVTGFSAASIEGWTVSSEAGSVQWADAGGATADPITFPVTVELAAGVPVGTTVHLTVLQQCAEGSVLWVAVDDDEAAAPAAVLVVGETVDAAEHHGTNPDAHANDNTTIAPEPVEDGNNAVGGEHAQDGDDGFALLALITLLIVVGGITGILRMDSEPKA